MPLTGKRFLMFVDDIYEDLELWYPRLRLIEAGAKVTMAGVTAGHVYHGKHSYPCAADVTIGEVHSADFAGVVIPGGFMPDKLRAQPESARVGARIRGGRQARGRDLPRRLDSDFRRSLQRHPRHRFARHQRRSDQRRRNWEDAPVVIDRHFVSSRKPDDLPAFCAGILKVLETA